MLIYKYLTLYSRATFSLLLSIDRKVSYGYGLWAKEVALILYRGLKNSNDLSQGKLDRWLKKNKALQRALKRIEERFRKGFYDLLKSNIQRAQVLAHKQIDALLRGYEATHLGYDKTPALEKTKIRFSQRIWNLSKENGDLIELYLRSGVKEGTSASEITKDLRQFLKEPDRLFRRIKNEKGQLALSKAAKEYHPGAGVYRSSYKNALRLARTQVNMAYHRTEYERWQKLPFVLGIEVRLSKVHKEGACICDHLQGRYPKNFLFLGWHPQCLCQGIPVLLSREDFLQYNKTGKIDPSKYIREIPKGTQEYLNTHADQIRGWKNRPYFIADNFKYIEGKGFIYKGL